MKEQEISIQKLTDKELDETEKRLIEELRLHQQEKRRRCYAEQIQLLTEPLMNSDVVYATIDQHKLTSRECRYIGEQMSIKFGEIFNNIFEPDITARRARTKRDSEARRERRNRQKSTPVVNIVQDIPADNIPLEMRTY